MESDSIANVYSEAKSEYMLQLTQYLTPAYFRFYLDLLAKAKDEMKDEPKRCLWQFQNLLAEVEDWNMERVTREIQSIINEVEHSGCDFLDDLLTAVFIAHTKVLAAVRLNNKNKNVQISLPKIDRFLFKVFCECSRLLWQSAYLFRDNVGSMEKQQNYRQIQNLIDNGIKAAIRSLVPVKSLLKDCMNSDSTNNDHDNDVDSDSDSDIETPPTNQIVKRKKKIISEPVPESSTAQEEPETATALEEPETATALEKPETATALEEPETVTAALNEPETTDKNITDLPVVKALVNIQKNDESPATEVSTNVPTIIVDSDGSGRKGVIFNEYETIFDVDEHGQIMQPTSFHDIENRPPEEDDDEDDDHDRPDQIDILEETGVPLGDDDLDDLNDPGMSESVAFDEFENL